MFGYSYMMGGTALLAGNLPAPMKGPIQIVATRGAEFVVPMVAVTGAAEVIGQLGKLKPKKRRRRSR
jgi:hypothetical protein